jgi:hypothetical protein
VFRQLGPGPVQRATVRHRRRRHHLATGGPTRIVSGGAEGSRLGFKGSEDLAPGYKAVFNLEARVELDTGTQQPQLLNDNQGLYLTRGMGALPPPVLAAVRTATQPPGAPAVNPENALFDRTTMAGMVPPYGALLLGRMYTPDYEVFAAADAFEVGAGGTWGSIISGTAGFTALGTDIRSQRAAQYRVALPDGLGGSLMAAGKGSGYYGRYNGSTRCRATLPRTCTRSACARATGLPSCCPTCCNTRSRCLAPSAPAASSSTSTRSTRRASCSTSWPTRALWQVCFWPNPAVRKAQCTARVALLASRGFDRHT